ncbi:MAG: iron-containing alcohol dehydrogenase [Breznakibacter sp.]
MELRKFVAPEFVFGVNAIDLAGRYAKNFGATRALLVSDPGVWQAGWAKRVVDSLALEGVEYVAFSHVSPNPRSAEVMEGADVFAENRCNVIVAVGGGSVIDCAKGIGIVSANGGHVLQYEGVDKVPYPMPPIICIPTTGGTSADVSQFAIINHEAERVKIAIISKSLVPDVALIDPATLVTMDNYLTACTGIDALVHAIEAYVSNASSSFSDLHAREAIGLITSYLPLCLAEPNNLEAREKVMLGSLYAGLAFSNASLGAVHAMAHSLGGYLDLPHGECNALLLPHVVGYNFDSAGQRYSEVARFMQLDMEGVPSGAFRTKLVDHLMKFRENAGVSKSLSMCGVTHSDIAQLARKAMLDPCRITNPRKTTRSDIEVIYREAL